MARLDAAIQSFTDVAVAHMDEIAPRWPGPGPSRSSSSPGSSARRRSAAGASSTSATSCATSRTFPTEVAVARDAVFAALDERGAPPGHPAGRPSRRPGSTCSSRRHRDQVGNYLVDGTSRRPAGAGFVEAFLESPAAAAGDRRVRRAVRQRPGRGPRDRARAASRSPASSRPGDEAQRRRHRDAGLHPAGRHASALAVALPAYLNAGGEGQVQGVWDYSLTVLTDGQKAAPGDDGLPGPVGRPDRLVPGARTRRPPAAQTDVEIRVLLCSEGEIQSVSVFDVSHGDGARPRHRPSRSAAR